MNDELLEREAELAELASLLDSAVGGQGGAVVVEAHAGVGKTRLLAAAADQAKRRSIRVAGFACGELERQLGWSAATGLLAGELSGSAATPATQLFSGAAAAARPVFEPGGPASPPARDPQGYDVVHGLFLLVGRLAQRGPLALLLDDAQWCDEQSLRFLLYLERRLDRLPVALVVTMRPGAEAGADATLREHLRTGARSSLHLRPLGEEAVARLVRRDALSEAEPELCHACWAATAGNPFYLRELLTELRSRPGPVLPGDVRTVAPASVARAVSARLSAVTMPQAAALARAAAILGDGAPLRHVAALAEIDAATAARIVDALAQGDILVPGEPVRFIHPLVRSALYSRIPAAWRARLHHQAATVLMTEDASPELVSVHLLHAPRRADPRTVAVLRAAATHSSQRGAGPEAVDYLRRALDEPPPADERAEVLLELARAEARTGDPAAAEHLRAALRLAADQRHRAEILLELGWAEHHAGRFAEAAATFSLGLQAAGDGDLAAELEAGYLGSAFFDPARAADAQARIGALARQPPARHNAAERALLAQALFARVMAGEPHHEVLDLARHLWDGGRLLEQEGADSQSLWAVIGALSWADDYAGALAATDQALLAADREGSALAAARGHYARAWPRFWTGCLAGAERDARMAVETWHGGLETYLPAAVYWLVLALLEGDRVPEAKHALALAGPAERWQGTAFVGFLLAAQGHLAAHLGDPEQALTHHLACGRVADELHFINPAIMPWRSQAALAARLTGDDEMARTLTAQECELARRYGAPRAYGNALRAAGLIERGDRCVSLLQEAVEALERSGAGLDHARAVLDLGAALRRAHQRAAARAQLTRALAFAKRAGAVRLAQQAATELRAAGGRGSRSAPGSSELTPSELRVAELAAAGHTNGQIARSLHVSVKAVEWHLHQTFRKLEIRSRHQLAEALSDAAR